MAQSMWDKEMEKTGELLRKRISALFGRSLALREVDAGSCNACEEEIKALTSPYYDLERFGVKIVASPRHADGLLVTGPVSRQMEIPLRKTFNATPAPKIVIAVGACAISGGIYGESYVSLGGVEKVLPVDVHIPGCPPSPYALIYGILLALDKVEQRVKKEQREIILPSGPAGL